jgi:hypothetical protein
MLDVYHKLAGEKGKRNCPKIFKMNENRHYFESSLQSLLFGSALSVSR